MNAEWIVPVVVMLVWLISALVKSRDEDPPPVVARREGPAQKKDSIVEFLQEVERIRRERELLEGGQRPSPQPAEPPTLRPPEPRPAPPEPRPKIKPKQKSVGSVKPKPRPAEPAPVLTVPNLAEMEPLPAAPIAEVQTLPPLPSAAGLMRPPTLAPSLVGQIQGPRESLVAIMVLGEILAKPKCRRR